MPHDRIESLKAWPRDFLPGRLSEEYINARIYTLGYNANMTRKAAPNATIDSYAEDLLSVLDGDRKEVPWFLCSLNCVADYTRGILERSTLFAIL